MGPPGTFSSNSKFAYQCSQCVSIHVPSGYIACAQWVHCMCSACVLHFLQSFGYICNVLQNELMYSKCTHCQEQLPRLCIFSLFFLSFRSLTHIPLSRPVMSLFILIFRPSLRACTRDIQPTRRVSFLPLFSDHVIDHLIAMCLPHGFVVTDPIAPSQSEPLLVSMFVLCWKPNIVRALCAFSIYSPSPP